MRNFILLMLCMLLSLPAHATVYVNRYPTNTAVAVCVPSDSNSNCGGSGGSGSVGIGTVNRAVFQIATTTTGTPYNILADANGNFGIGTATPGTALDVTGTGRFTSIRIGASNVLTGTTGTGANIATSTTPTFTTSIISPIVIGAAATTGALILEGTSGNSPTTASNTIIRNTGGTGTAIAAFIDSASNIGLGTTGPQPGKLMVLGGIGIGTVLNGDPYLRTTPPSGGMIIEGNLGIGTYDSNSKLEVANNDPAVLIPTTSTSAIRIRNTSTTDNTFSDLVFSTLDTLGARQTGTKISGVFVSHTAAAVSADMAFSTNVAGTMSEKMRLTSAGNLGIGTLAPAATLDVIGSIKASTSIGLGTYDVCNASGNCPSSSISGANPSATIGLTAVNGSASTYLRSDGAPALGVTISPTWTGNHVFSPSSGNTLFSSGNVGIGSVNPLSVLDIGSGNFTIQGVTSTGVVGSGNFVFSGAPTFTGNVVLGTGIIRAAAASTGLLTLTGANTASVTSASGIKLMTGAAATTEAFRLQGLSGNIGIGSFALNIANMNNTLNVVGNIGIGTSASSTFVNTTASAGGMVVEGNVGIGTTSTPYKLDLTVNGTTPVRFQTTGQTLPNILTLEGSGNGAANRGAALLFNVPVNTGPVNGVRIDAGEETNTGTAYMAIETGITGTLTEKMRVTSSGNVGIGTINPLSKFIVTGGGVGIGTNINSAFIQSSAPNGGMLVEGNVGIGTVSPNAILNVVSTANVPQFRVDDDGANDASPFVIDANGNVGIGTSITQTDKLLVMGGNVGVGTWVPSTTFDVQGGVNISGNTGIGTFVAPNQNALLNIATTNAQTLFRIDDNGIGDTTPLIVTSSGNVGIGTATPNNLLEILNGNFNIFSGSARIGNNVGIGTIGSSNTTEALDISGGGVKISGPRQTNSGSGGYFDWFGGSFRTVVNGPDNSTRGLYQIGTRTLNFSNFLISYAIDASGNTLLNQDGSNVGIGTASPSALLDIGGNIYIDRSTHQIIGKDSGGGGGCTKLTMNLGVGTFATVACP